MPHITSIKISNLFGIEQFESDGSSIELTGKNGAGKSSVIDAIKYALTNKSDRRYIIKDGANHGSIYIGLDDGTEITRVKKSEGTDTKKVMRNGLRQGSEESFLKGIFTPLQINPVEFLSLSEAKQNAAILSLIHYDWDVKKLCELFGLKELPFEILEQIDASDNILSVLDFLQSDKSYWYQHRRDVNNEAEHLEHIIADQFSSLPLDYDVEKWRNASAADIYMKVNHIQEQNSRIDEAAVFMAGIDGKRKNAEITYQGAIQRANRAFDQNSKMYDDSINSLEQHKIKAIADFDRQIQEKKNLREALAGKRDKAIEIAGITRDSALKQIDAEAINYAADAQEERQDVTGLLNEAKNIDHMKSFVRIADELEQNRANLEQRKKESDELTALIQKARTLPGAILETADIPVEGLSVKDKIALINGLPVSNLSEGEKLELCVNIAAEKQGLIRLILIDGIEKLSTELRNRLYEVCKQKGIQVIATRTTDDDVLEVVEL